MQTLFSAFHLGNNTVEALQSTNQPPKGQCDERSTVFSDRFLHWWPDVMGKGCFEHVITCLMNHDVPFGSVAILMSSSLGDSGNMRMSHSNPLVDDHFPGTAWIGHPEFQYIHQYPVSLSPHISRQSQTITIPSPDLFGDLYFAMITYIEIAFVWDNPILFKSFSADLPPNHSIELHFPHLPIKLTIQENLPLDHTKSILAELS